MTMTTERPPLSIGCARGAHGFCDGTMETCGCTECHFFCSRCFTDCRRLYRGSVCATCYRAETAGRPATRCEHRGCAGTHAYVDLRHRSAGYLCIQHHKELGHDIVGKGGER